MNVRDVTISGERKRPAGQYASDALGASVRIELQEGDDPLAAIAEGKRLVAHALEPSGKHGPAPAAAAKPMWRIRVPGNARERLLFNTLGLRWDKDAHATEAATEEAARDLVRIIRNKTSPDREVLLFDPEGQPVVV